MAPGTAVVVTTIAEPGQALRQLAAGCIRHACDLIIVGDESSLPNFDLEGSRFYSLKKQLDLGLRFAEICPTRHYARKNIGYLLARQAGATVIIETDDDNIPDEGFWLRRNRRQNVAALANGGFVNVYRYFSGTNVWPRGFPLEKINETPPVFADLPAGDVDCPIQQGLCDRDPDVDAIFRLTQPLPLTFRSDRRVALGSGSWCPFNSQNTTWWAATFPLLYLPAYCSFRMTDIWRSFVAQRIAWTNGWSVLFHEPTMRQERNQHDLMQDFAAELPGYLRNKAICDTLASLSLRAGEEHLNENLQLCYEALIRMGVHDPKELNLLSAWIDDLDDLRMTPTQSTEH